MARLFKPSAGAQKKRSTVESTPTKLAITDLSSDGRGVARHQGKTVFVEGALPGEQVEVIHYRRHKRFSECQTKAVIEPSAERVSPPCQHAQLCGGCQLQHLQADKQVHYKQASVLSLLKRQAGVEPKHLLDPVTSTPDDYRSRVRFAVSADAQLAFRQQGSDQLVPIEQCSVLQTSLQVLMAEVQRWLLKLPKKSGITHIELISTGSERGVLVRHIRPLNVEHRSLLQQLIGDASCWFQSQKEPLLTSVDESEIDPRLHYSPTAESMPLGFHPKDFTQVNPLVNQAMVDQALSWLELESSDHVADLFCGIGNFTLPMSQLAAQVTGIEAVESMVERGRENARHQGIENVDFKALNLETQALRALLRNNRITKVLLDPPRAGAKFVCEQIATSNVDLVVYVSCNPASLARDAKLLADSGYKLVALRVLDMFPHTAHVESMALFTLSE